MRNALVALVIGVALVAPLSSASVDGLTIHSSTAGTGAPTLVFVHGWTCDSSSWTAQVPAFTKKYRVITLDLPGHGKSGSPKDGKFSMDLFARAVEAVRAEAKAERIVLVGHSMGAPVIREYARLYPQRVAGLVAVDGPLDLRGFPPPGFKLPPPMVGADGLKARETMIRSMFIPQTPEPLQKQILSMMLAAPEATANGAMAATFDASLNPGLRSSDVIKAPALAVFAGTAQVPNAQTTKEILPNYESAQIAGTGHFLMMEKPEEFNRLLTAFLDKIKY
jgi:pimeloyl-ACP methyl ester carboxylesterase